MKATQLLKLWSGFAVTLVALVLVPLIYLQAWDYVRTDNPFPKSNWTGSPDYAFIGHSYTGSRIDIPTLESYLDDEHAALVWGTSAGPDIWYLMLKNKILVDNAKPKYVFSFFSANQLTIDPGPPVDQRRITNLLQNRSNSEPDYDAVTSDIDFKYWLTQQVEKIFPIENQPTKLTDQIVRGAGFAIANPKVAIKLLNPLLLKEVISSRTSSTNQQSWNEFVSFKETMKTYLTSKNLREVRGNADTASPQADRWSPVGEEYLSLAIDLANEHDIQWVFIQARIRPNQLGVPASQSPPEYEERLEKWLTANGAIYIDLSDRTDILDGWYNDSAHTFGHEAEYTAWFYQEFKEEFFE